MSRLSHSGNLQKTIPLWLISIVCIFKFPIKCYCYKYQAIEHMYFVYFTQITNFVFYPMIIVPLKRAPRAEILIDIVSEEQSQIEAPFHLLLCHKV